MKIVFTLSLFLFSFSFSGFGTSVFAAQTPKVKFVTGSSFNAIKQRAKAENKLIFIDFFASWCAPCELMDETTFNDERLAAYVDENYIAYKVDVEDFEGYNLKQLFNIKALPTFLIFDANGVQLARHEESMAASRFLQELKKHDTPKNHGFKAEATDDDAPVVIATTKTTPVNESPRPKAPVRVPMPPVRKPVAPAAIVAASNKEEVKTEHIGRQTATTTPVPTEPTPTKRIVATEPKLPTTFGEGLYEFNVKKHEAKGFSLQTNTFSQLAFVLKEVSKLQTAFPDEPILVSVATIAGKSEPVYRILIGDFDKEAQTEPLKLKLKAMNITPALKNLATLVPAK